MVYAFRKLLGSLESAINAQNKCLTVKRLQQGYRYHKLRKTFSKFCRRHYELISKLNVELNVCVIAFQDQNVSVTWFINLR